MLNPLPTMLNSYDSATASDYLPVQMVFNNPFTQPFRITSMVRSNDTVSLTRQSVPGQSYVVEASTDLANSNGWMTVATNLLATNCAMGWEANFSAHVGYLRVRR